MKMKTKKMFGLEIVAEPYERVAIEIITRVKAGRKFFVVTPNVDHIMLLQADREFFAAYRDAGLVIPDGMPLVWLSKMLPGPSIPERVAGTDLLFRLCSLAAQESLSVAFVGGRPGAAETAAKRMAKVNSGLKVAGFYCPPWGFERNEEESRKIVALVNTWHPNILFFGVGAPKQEKWLKSHFDDLQVNCALCVGAGIEFAANLLERAPKVMQQLGLEWAFRLWNEPRRLWKRYLVKDIGFFWLAMKELGLQWPRTLFKRGE